jgi:uncharacterized membrane protein
MSFHHMGTFQMGRAAQPDMYVGILSATYCLVRAVKKGKKFINAAVIALALRVMMMTCVHARLVITVGSSYKKTHVYSNAQCNNLIYLGLGNAREWLYLLLDRLYISSCMSSQAGQAQ